MNKFDTFLPSSHLAKDTLQLCYATPARKPDKNNNTFFKAKIITHANYWIRIVSFKMSTLQTSSLNVTAGSFSYRRLPLTKKTPTNNHKPAVSQITPPVQRQVL